MCPRLREWCDRVMAGINRSESLNRDEVRARLHAACKTAQGRAGAGEGDESAHGGAGVPAAVLVGLMAHDDEPYIVLTERKADLKVHPSEISLPGGRVEPEDEGPAAAALREAQEEIGLPSDKVELLGCLPPYETVSGYCVYPMVGWIESPVNFVSQEREVADVFEVPLSFVLDPRNRTRESILYEGEHHWYYVLPYPGRRIWGATAGILVSLARALGC